ncbi:MAG: alpha/beta hydrolase [Clostridia bacterium]|nr:alpha/beta hydrolase [Clostridia bacterium]
MKVFKNEKGKQLILQSYDKLLKMWDVEYIEEDIQTTYGMTHVIKVGDSRKRTVIMFHGVGDNSAIMWLFNAKELSEHFYLIAVDTIGGPNKSIPNEKYNGDFNQIKWVDEVIDGLKVDHPSLIGVSNGAGIIQNYGPRNLEKIDKTVSMAGGLLYGKRVSVSKMLKVFLPEALFPSKKNVIRLLNKLTGEDSAVFTENPALMEHWMLLLKYFNNMSMGFHKMTPLTDDEVNNISKRMLVMIGDEDPIAYSRESEDLLKKMNINYLIVKNTGHAINHEKASLINKTIIDYLK